MMSRSCRIFFRSLWRLGEEQWLKLPRLREVREIRGWSQGVLAEKSDVSRDSISNYETGQREAYPATARKLADALNVSVSELEKGFDWRAGNLEMVAEGVEQMIEAVKFGRETLDAGDYKYTLRAFEILESSLRDAAEHLQEMQRIERGEEQAEESAGDQLNELMREWQAEKA